MQHSDALGAAGDVARDGVGAPSREVAPTVADKLRTLADWLDAHPAARVHDVTDLQFGQVLIRDLAIDSAGELADKARSIGGRWEKEAAEGSELFRLTQEILPGFKYELVAWRKEVCERVVVGEREVEVADPRAPKVTVTQEIVEWRCGPLLATEPKSPAPTVTDPDDLPF